MTIDSLSVFFWAWAALIFWKALHRDHIGDWFWLGLAIGAGFLAKFTNGIQIGCIAFFLLWSKEYRPLLFSQKTLVMCAAFAVSILPILWWNMQTGWVHAMALHSRSGVSNSFQIRPLEVLKFLGQQFGVISPLIMAGMLVAAIALACRPDADLRARFLLSQYLPVYGLFLFFSLNKAGLANWPAPALITGIIFTVVYWREMMVRIPAWRWGVRAAFALGLLLTVLLHDTDFLHLPPAKDPLRSAKGWEDFSAHVQRAREKFQANLLIADHYAQASLMSFYLPDQPTTFLLPADYGSTQFTLWPGYQVSPGTRALYVTGSTTELPQILLDEFKKVELEDDFWSQHHGRPMTEFRIYLCTHD
jgi:hypothetical protein